MASRLESQSLFCCNAIQHLYYEVFSTIPATIMKAAEQSWPHIVVHAFRFIGVTGGLKFLSLLRRQPVQIIKRCVYMGGSADIHLGCLHGRKVAVKEIRLRQADQFDKIELSRECAIMSTLKSHPNIIEFLDVYCNKSRLPAIVTPWMDYGTLADTVKLKPPPGQRRMLVQQLADGMLFLKSSNVIHGDLKANNILINSEGKPCIADFGLACYGKGVSPCKTSAPGLLRKFFDTTTKVDDLPSAKVTWSGGGSTRWMAPELLVSEISPQPTFESDIFSFGMVIYEIYSGHLPFYEFNNFMAILHITQGNRPDRPSSAPDDIWSIAKRSWNEKPALRPAIEDIYRELPVIRLTECHGSSWLTHASERQGGIHSRRAMA